MSFSLKSLFSSRQSDQMFDKTSQLLFSKVFQKRQRTTFVVIRGELAGVLCSNYLLITDLNIDNLKVAAQTAVVALN